MNDWLTALFARVDAVTAVQPPWRSENHGCARLSWREPGGHDGNSFAGSFHQGDGDADEDTLGALDSDVPGSVVASSRPVIEQWIEETPARLREAWPFVRDVQIVLVSPEDNQALQAFVRVALISSVSRSDPWMVSMEVEKGAHRRFLIFIPVPQEQRRESDFDSCFVAQLRHELEHVFQIAALRDDPANGWRPFAEQGAVGHESRNGKPNPAALDYAHPCHNDGYHMHPFCEWLETSAPGLLDEAWLYAGANKQHRWNEPLSLLNSMLRDRRQTSLPDVWTSFCLALPFPGALASLEIFRQPDGAAVLQSFAVDLAADTSARGRAFRLPYVTVLSCHFAVVRPHPDRPFTLTVTLDPDSCPQPVDLRIRHAAHDATSGQNPAWEEIPGAGKTAVAFVIPPGPASLCHWFAFVFANVRLPGLSDYREPKTRADFCRPSAISNSNSSPRTSPHSRPRPTRFPAPPSSVVRPKAPMLSPPRR
jgi:hypothetical protein